MELKDLVKYYVPMRMEGSSPPNWEVVFGYDISKFKGYNVDEVRVALNLTQLWLSQGPRDNGLLYVIRFFEGGIGQNVYSMGTIHRRKCTHCRLEITSTMRRCFLVISTMSRHIEKNETRNKNRSFHMKRKEIVH